MAAMGDLSRDDSLQDLHEQEDPSASHQLQDVPPKSVQRHRDQTTASEGRCDDKAPAAAIPSYTFPGEDIHDEEGRVIHAPLHGRRMYPDRRSRHYRQGPLGAALALVTMGTYLCWIHILTALLLASFYSRAAAVLLAGIWATVLLPAKPLLWPAFLRNPVLALLRAYFNVCVVVDWQGFDLQCRYVYAATLVDVAWPGHDVYSVAASSLFVIPLWRHVMSWIGARPATEGHFRRLLQRGSVAVVPGGIAEMFRIEHSREVVVLSRRKGFCRMAVEAGAPIVPVYHFGNSRLFDWGPKSWEAASRRHRVSLGFLLGLWKLPLPRRVPLMVAIGKPLSVRQVAKDDAGFEAAVDAAHADLVTALRDLYERYRGLYDDGTTSWAERPLVID